VAPPQTKARSNGNQNRKAADDAGPARPDAFGVSSSGEVRISQRDLGTQASLAAVNPLQRSLKDCRQNPSLAFESPSRQIMLLIPAMSRARPTGDRPHASALCAPCTDCVRPRSDVRSTSGRILRQSLHASALTGGRREPAMLTWESWFEVGLPALPAAFTLLGIGAYWWENPLPALPQAWHSGKSW
jgi:hypothetical protein